MAFDAVLADSGRGLVTCLVEKGQDAQAFSDKDQMNRSSQACVLWNSGGDVLDGLLRPASPPIGSPDSPNQQRYGIGDTH